MTPEPTPSTAGQSQPRSLAAEDRPRPYDDFTYWTADDCRKPGTGADITNSTGGGRIVNHFQRCAWKQHAITLWSAGQLYPLGTIAFRLTMMARASEDGRTIEVTFRADEVQAPHRRALLADVAQISMTPSCSADDAPATCSMTPSNRQTVSVAELEAVGLTFSFRSPQAATTKNPISLDTGQVSFPYYFTSPPNGQQTDQITGGIQEFSMSWRCDSAQLTRKEFKKEACVFPTLPHLTLNINDAGITESAQHIRQAQQDPNSTDPTPPANGTKTIPSKITRHWDAQLNANQRAASRAACVAAEPEKPANTDCDEYPFASTLEGSLAPPLPNYNFSVRYINSSDNRRSGCWMGLWLIKDRVLAKDQYQVDVYDGPVFPEPPPEPPECAEEEQ
ncbi:hypothetical protein ACIA58_17845 [Kribbella sp. NPDC051586]|uniref:NucA/NucB deoxyribonuclease domain-containing protein n=1 Tax=Kribbella sp. NPDC051586 TaxID=3364118 RepID=UPI0037891ADE